MRSEDVAVSNVFHYTDKAGYNGIRSNLPSWRFAVSRPRARDRPPGVYFTTLAPSEVNLGMICKKLRIPRPKRDFVFWFSGAEGLEQLNGGRGRDQYILFSPVEYLVERPRQRFSGTPEEIGNEFS